MSLSKNTHLTKDQTIKQGSFFTPEHIVQILFDIAKKKISFDDVIVDFGAGYGAFENIFCALKNKIIATDMDAEAVKKLKENFSGVECILENSLALIDRDKYAAPNAPIVAIGNPPYNDVTSAYKKGQKGGFECDERIKSRDMGISFLKLYDALGARLVFVLHPMAYLIKKNNFVGLGNFKAHYILKQAMTFSSAEFESVQKGNSGFPVVAAFYERNENGMDFDFVKNFKFDVLNSTEKFCLNDWQTIDGIIQKYPQKKDADYEGLQFYTLRDINALKRNATFLDGKCANGIRITAQNLYQYAWLDYFKETFRPKENAWLYGNLSPFYDKKIESVAEKRRLVRRVWETVPLVQKYFSKKDLEPYYGKF